MTAPDDRRRLTDLAHALDAFADALRLDRVRPTDEAALRDLAGAARVLTIRPHQHGDVLALVERVPRLVEPDHRATHSTYGHYQLRLDTAAGALRAD